MIPLALALYQSQLVDSTLESTRVFWRARAGASETQQLDPRPFAVVLADQKESPNA